jgi:hypothetical protein
MKVFLRKLLGGIQMDDEQWKKELYKKAQTMGIINDPQWLTRLNEPMPVWAVLEIVLKLIDIVDPPSKSYD